MWFMIGAMRALIDRLRRAIGLDEIDLSNLAEDPANRLRRLQIRGAIEQMRVFVAGNTFFAPVLALQAWNLGINWVVVTWAALMLGFSWWLFAPACTYPAHTHDGITESYICLSGAVSENHQGVYAPGSLIFNPPEQLHRITVADTNPALLFYAWEGSREKLANQKMVFRRKSK